MNLAVLVLSGLVAASVFSSLLSFRIGAPLLLVFLGVGLAAGAEGLGLGPMDGRMVYLLGSAALAVVLFDSGFHTPVKAFRLAAAPALSLATVGVVLTAAVVAVPAHLLLGLDWPHAGLLGSILASTDAAAVFFLLRVGGITVRDRTRSLLEVESGCNDPVAIFLTMALAAILAGQPHTGWALAGDLARQFLYGGLGGLAGGMVIVQAVNRLGIERSLLPILALALALMLFSAVGLLGGSGFLAVYIAGLVAGNARLSAPQTLKRFQDGISWLAQIGMFVSLGLLARPSEFGAVALPAMGVAVVLTLVARPLAVFLALLPFRITANETFFVSWVGLRGAVSILMAILPMILGVAGGSVYFNVAFLVVVASLAVQGWTIGPVARWMGQIVPRRTGPVERVDLELPGAHHALVAYRIVPDSLVARGHRLPRWAMPSLVVRDGGSMLAHIAGPLVAGDMVWLFARPDRVGHLDHLFARPAEAAEADRRFFGDFPIEPTVSMGQLALSYGLPVNEDGLDRTVADYLADRFGGRPGIGDRVLLGDIELIVRALDEAGGVAEVGFAAEPTRLDAPRLAMFEPGERLKAWVSRLGG